MCKIIGITNRHLCEGDYYAQIEKVIKNMGDRLEAIVVREKDLQSCEYMQLAGKVMDICEQYSCTCILHNFHKEALELGCNNIHLPLHVLEANPDIAGKFEIIGVSTHSVEDAIKAQALGATYITAGHVFATDCKKGVPPRGLIFLRNVCKSVDIPVYAIGGINDENIKSVIEAGAQGGCVMSGIMKFSSTNKGE